MKLSWKLFFITTPVFVLLLTVFSGWIVGGSFQKNLEQEIQKVQLENELFENSYELLWHSLSQKEQESVTVKELVERISSSLGGNDRGCRIYDETGSVVYEQHNRAEGNDILAQLKEAGDAGYEIIKEGDAWYLAAACKSSLGLVMETVEDISALFEEREQMYAICRIGVLILAALMGAVMLAVLFFVMRNMQKLSRAVRRFAGGQYHTKVNVTSRDEIGQLAEDFNWMMGIMNTQMEQLRGEVQRQEAFSAAFAHELKTPLTAIIGYADTLRQMELSKEERDMCASYIYSQGKRLQSLSFKLLDLTMAGRTELRFAIISVPEFLQEIGTTVSESLKEKNLRLQIEAEAGLLYGDRDLLASLFINLIDNSRKASREGRSISLTGQNLPNAGGYLICVKDEGSGIPPEELHRVTEAFYMVDKSRARKEGGAGLGLALCQKIVELHCAAWQFANLPGAGLQVSVRFGAPQTSQRRRERRRREERSK